MNLELKKLEMIGAIGGISASMKVMGKAFGETISRICAKIEAATDEGELNDLANLLTLAVNFGQQATPSTVEAFQKSMEKILTT